MTKISLASSSSNMVGDKNIPASFLNRFALVALTVTHKCLLALQTESQPINDRSVLIGQYV